jgi:hypothetical protein
MMRALRLLLCLVLPVAAQVTSTTPAAFTGSDPTLPGGKFAQRETGPSPFAKQLVINGTGAWNIGTITGTASVAIRCGFAGQAAVSNCTLSGTAPSTIFVFFDGYTNNYWTAGTKSAVIPIVNTGATVNVSLDIEVKVRTSLTITSPSGLFTNCSHTVPGGFPDVFLDLDTCDPITDQRPGGTFTPPALGASYVDAQFGATVKRIAGGPNLFRYHDYATIPPCNINDTRCFISRGDGTRDIVNPSDGSVVHSAVTPGNGFDWDKSDPTIYYYFTGKTIRKVVLPALTDTLVHTYPGTSATIDSGGTGGLSKDNWWVYKTDATDKQVCAINLDNVAQNPCASYNVSPALGVVDFVQISKGTSVSTGKRYVFVGGINYTPMFQFADADSSLTAFGRMPAKPSEVWYSSAPLYETTCTDAVATSGWCYKTEHQDTVEIGGEQYLAFGFQQSNPFLGHALLAKIAAGDLMTTASEAGGGGYYNLPQTNGNFGMHPGCAKQGPFCVFEKYPSPTVTSFKITNATNATPIVITSDPAYTGINGNVVLINNVGGNLAANGKCTVAGLSGATFNCSGSVGNGTYTSGTGAYTLDATPATSSHGFELYVTVGLNAVRRVAIHRSVPFSNTYTEVGGYYSQPRTPISATGNYLYPDSNMGYPDGVGVFQITTGLPGAVQGGVLTTGARQVSGNIR